jgi:hypothetical protein
MVKRFTEFRSEQVLYETYLNFVGDRSKKDRLKWADQAYALLQKTYASIGGIKGSGFSSANEMVEKIPFWKLHIRGEHIVAAFFYKDTSGRKLVAGATDNTALGKKILAAVLKESLGLGWGEYSKALLKFIVREVGLQTLGPYLIDRTQVERLLGGEVIIPTDELVTDLSVADQKIYKDFKSDFADYFYIREIGGIMLLKIAIGTSNKTIK